MPGTLLFPVQGPITSPFGARTGVNPLSASDFHTGIDFGVPVGTPIYATMSGYFSTEQNYGGGLMLRVKSLNGTWETVYAHTSRSAVAAGAFVRQGQLIGFSGMSGHAVTGAHLHYEVKRNGVSVNPQFVQPVDTAMPLGLGRGSGFNYDAGAADAQARMQAEQARQAAEQETMRRRSVLADFSDISRSQRQPLDVGPSAINFGSKFNTTQSHRKSRFV